MLTFDRILDTVYVLNGKINLCIFGNVVTLQIIQRNKILGNNGLIKVASNYNKVWLTNLKKGLISKTNVTCY